MYDVCLFIMNKCGKQFQKSNEKWLKNRLYYLEKLYQKYTNFFLYIMVYNKTRKKSTQEKEKNGKSVYCAI